MKPSSTYATGITKSRLSKRSRMPPCPGMSVRAVFHAGLALEQRFGEIADLRRDADDRAEQRARPPDCSESRGARRDAADNCVYTHATSMLASKPPIAPSTVFPGLTDGMSLCLPIARPTAYAPMSDAQVTSTGNNSSRPPDGMVEASAEPSGTAASANAYS